MPESRKTRFRYCLKTDRYREQKELIFRELPHREAFRTNEVVYYLNVQGYHLNEGEVRKIAGRMFGKADELSVEEMIGIVARLGVEDEVEREMRKVFYFFSGGEEVLTAADLRGGMERLGEGLKEREVNQILLEMDLNSDGYIDFETFLEAMMVE